LLRETVPFVAISVVTGAVLIEASHLGYRAAGALGLHGIAFYAFAQGSYLAANGVTFILRFVIFNFLVFADHRPGFVGLYARYRLLIHEGARFGLVGLAGFVVTVGGANLLRYQAGMGRLSAFAIATVVAAGYLVPLLVVPEVGVASGGRYVHRACGGSAGSLGCQAGAACARALREGTCAATRTG
jgi:hypothetical protein